MVVRATVATITILVAAESPPIKTNTASTPSPSAMGRVNTKVSGSTVPSGKCSNPPKAIGNTKMLMTSKYRGNSQTALLR